MHILFFKATHQPDSDSDNEPTADKMRRILESHVEEAETDEDREMAESELRRFNASAV